MPRPRLYEEVDKEMKLEELVNIEFMYLWIYSRRKKSIKSGRGYKLAEIKHSIKLFMKSIFMRKEYHISFSNIGNKSRYYIIRRKSPGAGFFSNYLYVLTHICYAIERGYKPVVDMQHYSTLYNEDAPINETLNCWKYYYTQPKGICCIK